MLEALLARVRITVRQADSRVVTRHGMANRRQEHGCDETFLLGIKDQ